MKKALRALTALILTLSVLLLCASCAGTGTDSVVSGGVNIVASFYPIYVFTANIVDGIDGITLTDMSSRVTGCLHDYTLTQKDMKAIGSADVFVVSGASLESFLPSIEEQLPELPVVDSSPGTSYYTSGGEQNEAASHIWMDVPDAEIQVNNIAASLEKLFPQYAAAMEKNRAAYIVRLEKLKSDMADILSGTGGFGIISFHDAFELFAGEFGLEVRASVEGDEGGEPSVRRLAALSDLIETQGIKAIFIQPDYRGSSARVLSDETGAKIYTLSVITSGDFSLTSYEDQMLQNARTVKEAADA